jgi:hypothetical protein
MNTETTYIFTSSQPLTKQQLEYLNRCMYNMPCEDTENCLDLPEYTTDIVEVK